MSLYPFSLIAHYFPLFLRAMSPLCYQSPASFILVLKGSPTRLQTFIILLHTYMAIADTQTQILHTCTCIVAVHLISPALLSEDKVTVTSFLRLYVPHLFVASLIHDDWSGPRTNERRQTEIGVSEIRAVEGVRGISQYPPSSITAWTISCRQVIDIPAHNV